jgi:predicted NUDIX family NTP pyrophosphohydrolase
MASRNSQSAGLLLFRGRAADLEVLLAHPGGPFWQNKDDGAWSIPKGLIGADEVPLSAARREFAEETGHDPHGDFLPLGEVRQPGGKVVQAWAIEGDWRWSGRRAPDADGHFQRSTAQLGLTSPTRDGRS